MVDEHCERLAFIGWARWSYRPHGSVAPVRDQGTQTEVDMKSRLHKGGPMELNLYSCNPPTDLPGEALLGCARPLRSPH